MTPSLPIMVPYPLYPSSGSSLLVIICHDAFSLIANFILLLVFLIYPCAPAFRRAGGGLEAVAGLGLAGFLGHGVGGVNPLAVDIDFLGKICDDVTFSMMRLSTWAGQGKARKENEEGVGRRVQLIPHWNLWPQTLQSR